MFAGFGRGHCLLRMVVGIAANGNGMEAFVREQRVEVLIDSDFAAVFSAECRGIEFARGKNRACALRGGCGCYSERPGD